MLDLRLAFRSAVIPLALALAACDQNNDAAINRAVQNRLGDQGVANEVQVTTLRRIVKLEGVVEDTKELNQAELAARDVKGVMAVDNRLVVKPSVGVTGATLPADPTPTTRVR